MCDVDRRDLLGFVSGGRLISAIYRCDTIGYVSVRGIGAARRGRARHEPPALTSPDRRTGVLDQPLLIVAAFGP